ncbi:Holliday junction branch migration protein RuvA [Corynebacterium epidermidicanis]|uniref:Holliday junction branch migration complex subunit RuvA n=1 Tax=Corynebacterium epidermidicanis TaxID=1050174 RepID=A0A0G3GWR9_9CORY|nr:Holliday junction branch migration protein RuvA [Corynebacterium epidermidicanis]AKK03277.1 Holliday junction DNA helicase subunit RuvA [Corynebacterium epidermidicanis]
MIASLNGEVVAIELSGAVIECGGVGYFFAATPRTLGTLKRGEQARILTTMVVREDAMLLYGFSDATSRELFSVLQSVSGLGPKLAMAALAMLTPEELANAITHSDAKALQRIPGVGKRMADRMVVELKDKVTAFATATPTPTAERPAGSGDIDNEQVVAALVGLGFNEKAAVDALNAVLDDAPVANTSQALRAALAYLGKK